MGEHPSRSWVLAVLLALLASPLAAAAAASGADPAADTATPSAEAVERLAGVARLWGRVKYFHPYLAYRDVGWDRALVETLPRVEAARSPAEYRAAVDHLLSFLGDPVTRTVDPAPGDEEHAALAGAIAAQEGAAPAVGEAPSFAVTRLDDGLALIDARAYPAVLPPTGGAALGAALAAAGEARGIVLDLRAGAEAEGFWAAYWLDLSLRDLLPPRLAEDLLLPALRGRLHSGYAPQDGGAQGMYRSGLAAYEHPVLAAGKEGEPPLPPLAILTDDGAGGAWQLLLGLETAGLATLVHQGSAEPFFTTAGWLPVELPDGVGVRLRSVEMVLPGGGVGGAPSVLLEAGEGAEDGADPALERALAVLRGEAPTASVRPPAPPPRQLREDPYPAMTYPERPYRLLALFRLWNVIAYFFPYKELMDRPWDEALGALLPRFAAAEDELAYTLAVAEAVAWLRDSHGFLGSEVFRRWTGAVSPPLTVRFVERRAVVTAVVDPKHEGAGTVRVGDVVLAVDGEETEARRRRLAPYLAVSTPQALDVVLARLLLAGEEGSEARLRLERAAADGAGVVSVEASVLRHRPGREVWERHAETHRLPVYTVLPEGYGYFDLTRLERAQVAEAFAAVRDTPALVLDLRGYPRGTAWAITPYLAAEPAVAARFRRPAYLDAELEGTTPTTEYRFEQPFPAGGPWQYEGRLVVLIDARAISQSEHSCLFFESARPDAVFVGTPTNGANGDVTTTVLPGAITVGFTGHDVRHADGRQLQRVGIQPHIEVAPTVAGLRAGRDEVLEAALAYLAGELESGREP